MNEFQLLEKPAIEKKTKDECLEDLKANYNNPGHPIAYSGINNIYKYYNGVLNINDINDTLLSFENYTLHREQHKGQRNISYSHFKRYQFQMDLVELPNLDKYNDGVKYLLNVIDTYTRYAFSKPLLDKSGPSVLNAFKSILEEAVTPPLTAAFDRGSEFTNKNFENFCKQKNIKFFSPYTTTHAAYIERFNRTLKSLVYKYMTENETNRFIDVLPDILKSYNNRIHRMTGVSPFDAENNPSNDLLIRKNMSKYYLKNTQKNVKFKIGDQVRIAKQKGKFSRGFHEQTTQEIFKIYAINTKMKKPMYYLQDFDGNEKIKGGFYDFELTKVLSDVFRVESVLKKRKRHGIKEIFVKWKGFSEKYNSWIPETNVTKTF
jgi:hypothetical protein